MKTTIKAVFGDVVVQPYVDQLVMLRILGDSQERCITLTPDQVGALIVGLECAAEKAAA